MLTEADIIYMRALIPQGILASVEMQAIGGATWTVSRPASNDGVSNPGSPTSPGSITGYAVSPKYIALATVIAGTSIPIDTWRLFTNTTQNLQVGDTITSAADSSLKFTIQSEEMRIGYVVYILQPTT